MTPAAALVRWTPFLSPHPARRELSHAKSQSSPQGSQVATAVLTLEEQREILANPVERIRLMNGWQGWSKQQEIVRALHKHKRVSVLSSHGAGKTSTAAAIIEDFMRLGPCRIVSTAPTWEQVTDILWAEINHRVDQAIFPWVTRPKKTSWNLAPDRRAIGLSPNVPERFQGHHGRRVLLVVDEASGVDERIFEAGQGFLTGAGSHVLYIGNGTRTTGAFYRSQQPDSAYHRVQISTFDTPAFTDERFEIHPELLESLPSQEWVDWMRRECSTDGADYEEDPEYIVRVLGQFANMDGRSIFRRRHLNALVASQPRRVGVLTGDPVRDSEVRFEDDPQGSLRIWTPPDKKNRRYVVFGDVAGVVREEEWEAREETIRGTGEDYCAAQVLDLETGEQVAEFHAHLDADVYARSLARLCYVYSGSDGRPAWLGVEANGVGQATLTELKHLKFRRVWRRQKLESVRGTRAAALGLVTTHDNKERMIAFTKATLREAPGRVHSECLISELRSFVRHKNGRAGASNGAHDDRVMAFAGALEMRDQVLRRPGSDEVAA